MIYVGTCGFSYKDWVGTFYPATIRQSEMLAFYSSCFSAVEVDSSYYGVPTPETIDRMNSRTPETFRFCFKVPQTVSHVPDAGLGRVHPDAQAFVRSVMPILRTKKFGCALLQFPNGFHPNERTERYVRDAIAALQPLPLVAEFRNREWQSAKYYEMLAELGVGWCNVDMPSYETLMHPGSDVTGTVGYVRFHGRNASKWWTGDNTTRYDYDYRADELLPWTDRIADMEEKAKVTYAIFNNHARGNAAKNANLLIDLLRERYGKALSLFVPPRSARPKQDSLFD
jgi:uncharacterized protein YecE (DUF72 family)